MNSNPEQRDKTRFDHEAPITLENFEIGVLHGARMFNFSNYGLYFESDYLFEPGTELYIGINNSPFASEPDVYECYRAVIRWRKPLKDSAFYYGYGAHFFEIDPRDERQISRAKSSRKHPRRPCSLPVHYSLKNKSLRGEIKNISPGGIFLKTRDAIDVGQRMQLAIPVRKKGKILQRTGKVVWSDRNGVGVKFIRTDDRKDGGSNPLSRQD